MQEGRAILVSHEERQTSDQPLPLLEHALAKSHQAAAKKVTAPKKPLAAAPKIDEETGIPIPAFLSRHDGDEALPDETSEEVAMQPGGETAQAESGEETAQDRADRKRETDNNTVPYIPVPKPEDEPENAFLRPVRGKTAIWPWLAAILLIIGASGFRYKQDIWLNDPGFRSLLFALHMPIQPRSEDWLIMPESVQGNWIERDDGSQVLVVQGRIENRLAIAMPLPAILVRFFDDAGIQEPLDERLISISEPPSLDAVKKTPFQMPAVDSVPVEGGDQRGFLLVIESLPKRTVDFSLTPAIGQ